MGRKGLSRMASRGEILGWVGVWDRGFLDYRSEWLGRRGEFGTRIFLLNENIFIPEPIINTVK